VAPELAATVAHGLKPHTNDLTVFVIPSWYPSNTKPAAGIFIRDQVLAVARERPAWRLAVSVWGQDETVVELRRPLSTFSRLRRRDLWSRFEHPEAPNVILFSAPVLHWTPRLRSGRFDAVLAANRKNLLRSRERFGGVDLIHAHASFPAALVAMELAAELGIPYVVTEHTGDALLRRLEGNEIGRRALGEALNRADAVIAVSEALARRLAQRGVSPTDVIPNVVDEEFFTPEPPGSETPPRAFALARLVDHKGIPQLIDAVAMLGQSDFPLELRIGGDGPRRRRWERYARGLGLNGTVSFLGGLTRNAVREEMRGCSCFVLPSESETFGVVCVEALACGRPVLATRSGGPESIVTERDGVLVPPRDVDALAAGLRTILTQQYDTEAIRAGAVQRFGGAAVTAALERVYRRVLLESSSPASADG
jgi:glycosyltransferase involved in cell wall biosynthesis